MLHAELHNKFDIEALEFERSEDILTSTVFGTLLAADGGAGILREWLQTARFEEGARKFVIPETVPDYRFWPPLGGCTPDLVIKFDDLLCVLEMKYRSAASDIQRDDAAEPELQLARQWEAARDEHRVMKALGIHERLRDASVLYVVDASRGAKRSRADVESARRRAGGDARIGLVYWQQLHSTLRRLVEQPGSPRWTGELAMLLERRQLGTFTGFSKRFDVATARHSRAILGWRRPRTAFRAAFEAAAPLGLRDFRIALSDWRKRNEL